MDATIDLLGYQITEELYAGNRTLVYRGIRVSDQKPVVIKLLRNEHPSFNELVQFRNQYTIAKNLNCPSIISTYNLEPYNNGYALIMEDFGGISLKQWIAKESGLALEDFLLIAIDLCTTLDILYQERIIHKDIKPANILINPDTKQIKLIDFSIASLLPRETQEIQNANSLEGTLAYISPEQTGRMNRGIDYRSDFYSLGVTFYELLTGTLPFQSNDPMELVHCHLAKTPISIHEINPKIPLVLSEFVGKLMAKNAEDRYQSALGIKYDLELCLEQLQATGNIESFKIGQRDISDRFTIPEKLYGRQAEVETLLDAFERVSQGSTELMLVAGFSGIGKTAVVNEVHKPIAKQRGYFIKGKFDQFQRNVPFSAFVQAFRDLMGQLLSESDAQLEAWKTKILWALGDNAQVMIEVIPELVLILGSQPPAVELSGTAAQNRFNLLFQKFLRVFTTQDHPLVLFIDDLQWADSASLNLMQLLLGDAETKYLLFLGAYRDNEVSPVHPFMLMLGELQESEVRVNRINLMPLSRKSLNHLVADTLSCSTDLAMPLTELVMNTAKGNPFFSTQLLKSLYEERLIRFDHQKRYWLWDRTAAISLTLPEDVVKFMALQLQKLPRSTQNVLKLAACIGTEFDLATLAIVSEQTEVEVSVALWEALQEELILPLNQVYRFFQGGAEISTMPQSIDVPYRFLHDRVQQAAYLLIPEDQKQQTHYQIGKLLLQQISPEAREERIFELVNQLNYGISLITQKTEQEELAQLNLIACRKAKSSTAYQVAREYAAVGLSLLGEQAWQQQYELTLNLYVTAGEVAYLNGDFDGMEQLATIVLQSAQTIIDKIKIYEIQIATEVLRSNVLEAIEVGRKVLGQLGVELPTGTDEAKTGEMLQTLATQLEGRQVEDLINLPVMTDPTTQAALEVMGMLFSPIIQGIPTLLPWLSSMMVSLSLKSGNTAASITGYGIHGMVLCAFLEDTAAGYAFGKLALSLLEKFHTQKIKPIVLSLFGCFIQHSQERLDATTPTLKAAYRAGIETGDFLQAGFSLSGQSSNRFFSGEELHSLIQDLADYDVALAQVKQYSAQVYLNLGKQAAENLVELVSQPHCLIGDTYNEILMLPKHQQDNDLIPIAQAYIYKLLLAYYFGNYPEARNYIDQAKPCLMAVSASIFVPIFHFYAALTHLALFPNQPETEQGEILLQVQTHQTILHQWADNAPMNHLHKWYLVEAERYRVLGEKVTATECYDKAISLSKEHQFINEEALANELAAKFYLDWGKQRIAQEYMTEAYYCYARWGAKAKVADIETRYPQLLQPILQPLQPSFSVLETLTSYSIHSSAPSSSPSSSSSISNAMDFTTILQAAQALSSTIHLDELLTKFTEIILQNSGADKCVLVLPHQETWLVRAISTTEGTTLCSEPLDQHPHLPVKLIQYVKHTQSMVLVDNLETDLPVIDDYLSQRQPKSLLGLPMLSQGKLVGILYMRNRSTPGVFTSDRLLVLNFLCAQAAISLENARLYQQAQAYAQQLEHSQLQMIQSEKMSALGNLVAGVAHEINNPVGFLKGNISPAVDYVNDLFGLLDLIQEKYPELHPEVQEEMETIDLEYIREDLPKLIGSMKTGVDRIRDISNSLRIFSRADTDRPVLCNIHKGIDSTIMILKHRLKADESRPEIQIIKNYENLPQVECYAGQINQVFMNILANAIDALDDSNQDRTFAEIRANPNCINITTSVENDRVKIAIADNGKGMSEEVKAKVFDHLFTTKEVGKGTGLGLAIAQQIIAEKHGGSLEVQSQLGKGTEFLITLPISSKLLGGQKEKHS